MSAKTASFEKNLERLQQIVSQLESGDLPLEKGVALFKEGQTLAAACRDQLETARLTVSTMTADGPVPFEADTEESS
jgi:exodeoxyribonuclease VII small subunit